MTMLIQIIVAYARNSKKSILFALDTVAILTGFKLALDAYRVGSGAEREEHQIVSPLQVMNFFKGVETVFEGEARWVRSVFSSLRNSNSSTPTFVRLYSTPLLHSSQLSRVL